jgi:hypothetical protein
MFNFFKCANLMHAAIGGLGGAGLSGGTAYATSKMTNTDAHVRSDPSFMYKTKIQAERLGHKPGSPEMQQFTADAVKKELASRHRNAAIGGALAGGAAGAFMGHEMGRVNKSQDAFVKEMQRKSEHIREQTRLTKERIKDLSLVDDRLGALAEKQRNILKNFDSANSTPGKKGGSESHLKLVPPSKPETTKLSFDRGFQRRAYMGVSRV